MSGAEIGLRTDVAPRQMNRCWTFWCDEYHGSVVLFLHGGQTFVVCTPQMYLVSRREDYFQNEKKTGIWDPVVNVAMKMLVP